MFSERRKQRTYKSTVSFILLSSYLQAQSSHAASCTINELSNYFTIDCFFIDTTGNKDNNNSDAYLDISQIF